MAIKLRKNDHVIVITGKYKGRQGDIIEVSKKNGNYKAKVKDVNLVKKHVKPNPNLGVTGGIVSQEAFIDMSNLAIYNKSINKADKVGFRFENGKKKRFYKSNKELI